MGQNNRGTVKECNQFPFLVTFLNLALIYCHIPFNPQPSCAVRVNVVNGLVCLSISQSISQHHTSQMSNQAINGHTYSVAYERQNICGDLPETIMLRNTSKKANMLAHATVWMAVWWELVIQPDRFTSCDGAWPRVLRW